MDSVPGPRSAGHGNDDPDDKHGHQEPKEEEEAAHWQITKQVAAAGNVLKSSATYKGVLQPAI